MRVFPEFTAVACPAPSEAARRNARPRLGQGSVPAMGLCRNSDSPYALAGNSWVKTKTPGVRLKKTHELLSKQAFCTNRACPSLLLS